ncbi:MAG: PadR family transcriptional regulator [Legionellales bacterium]|nr:PadR family transcriptional regulator [Legionellales bacterium]
MARKNTTRYAILGVLSTKPKSAYQIQKVMRSSICHFWSESDGQIYPMLKKLTAEKLLDCHAEATPGGRVKKIYHLTKQGRDELKRWLKEDIHPEPPRIELLLKLYFSHNVSDKIAIQHLEKKQQAVAQALADYQDIEKNLLAKKLVTAEDRYAYLSLQFGIQHAEMLLNWCEFSVATIKKWKLS